MNIEQLRRVVNSMTPEQLQDFEYEAQLRNGVNTLLGKPVREHLLAATITLIHDRMIALGLKPKTQDPRKSKSTLQHIITHKATHKPRYKNEVKVTKVSSAEMEKLWV